MVSVAEIRQNLIDLIERESDTSILQVNPHARRSKRILFILSISIACGVSLHGQSTYFNVLYGDANDLISDGITNVEWHPDGIACWGGGIDTLGQFKQLRAFDLHGSESMSNVLTFEPEFVYSGTTTSFERLESDGGYVCIQGSTGGPDGLVGFAMRIDDGLDTLWSRRYAIYDETTYFETCTALNNSILIGGSFDVAPGEHGSFIAEMDLQGDILWQQVVHEPSEGVYRISTVSQHGAEYVTTGSKDAGNETRAVMDVLNSEGEILYSYVSDQADGRMRHHLIDDDIITSESFAYEKFVIEAGFETQYNSLWLKRLDLDNDTLIEEALLFDDHEMVNASVVKMVSDGQGGKIVAGGYRKPVADGDLDLIGFILKLNSDYELEWFTDLRADDDECPTCSSYLWDMEPTADGGYVGAGYFIDYAIDGRRRSWLIKVDACGDVVYNGCGAEELSVGLEESEALEDYGIRVYPNPSSDVVHIEMQEVGASVGIILRDLQGREILRSTYRPDSPIDIAALPAGSYLIEALHDDGSRIGISVIELVK